MTVSDIMEQPCNTSDININKVVLHISVPRYSKSSVNGFENSIPPNFRYGQCKEMLLFKFEQELEHSITSIVHTCLFEPWIVKRNG